MYDVEITRPLTLEAALRLLEEAPDGQVLAGGQTLIPTLKQRLAAPELLVSLGRIEDLRGVSHQPGMLVIGAATTHATVARDAAEAYPALAALAGGIGDPAVRNRGTIGGSLANNDPAACYPAAVLASGATIVTSAREIAAEEFFDGLFTTALDEGEIITAVRVPVPRAAAYLKFAQPASRFALAGVFVAVFDAGVRVAVTGAGDDGVFRWEEAEAALDRRFDPEALAPLALDEDAIMGDIHAGPAYRAHLVKLLTRRAVDELLRNAAPGALRG
ncbi:FAD binding domain-containing protein [Poseidonocella sedimentorum]|uniref:Carbon-monoxide dehydrogenase medium subunit n=1 Tax=Poseidonocella sedimentorum TaxID=871652 RepID=A0A1I6CUE9_9RHOB|nr:FAD binding domain-containing protein [Poseidonocella sedimentorum]SFQ96874.1 carbon-monoxide dehydrogenase medium subunit [Poseidonocella sedimentorum]